ncbi:unnamed protein product [Effrenium voratum]|uniref:Uncharacterized protein n=1 Tax=Effrenium voratum TaxID=2562239 RepID=A0AA36IXR1_9DINO|nr:unnamed protein product [Effrenium voratum]
MCGVGCAMVLRRVLRLQVPILFLALARGLALCRPGSCQALDAFVHCEYDGTGAAGGGNTIATAICPEQHIVVRVALETPSFASNASGSFIFSVDDMLDELRDVPHDTAEAEFVRRAIRVGLTNSEQRPLRRWISKQELMAENYWRQKVVWNAGLVFEVASPDVACEFCLPSSRHRVWRIDSHGRWSKTVGRESVTAHVSIMKTVTPLSLTTLSVRELLTMLAGYVEDLSSLAQLNMWHDCHLGNLLMHQRLGKEERYFLWHDFGAASRIRSPSATDLQDFWKKMRDAMNQMKTVIGTMDSSLAHVPTPPLVQSSEPEILKKHLREYAGEVHRYVMTWTGDIHVRRAVLRSLSRALPSHRLDELSFLLVEGKGDSQPSAAVWVCQLRSPDGKEPETIGSAFKVTASVSDVDDLKKAIKVEEELTIATSKIDIYSKEDGRWVKEEKMSASLRDTDEADCYGFTLPAGAAGAA